MPKAKHNNKGMEAGGGGSSNGTTPRITRNSVSMQSLEAAAHAAAVADGLVIGGARNGGTGTVVSSGSSVGDGRGSGSGTSGTSSGRSSPRVKTESKRAGYQVGGTASPPSPTANSTGGKKQKQPGLRRGKWTSEEEAYANRLIEEFKSGLLPLTEGTTLRTFLSIMLNCDPMRISKKFVGPNCIGKQVFRRKQQGTSRGGGGREGEDEIEHSRVDLAVLERKFLEKIAQSGSSRRNGRQRAGASDSETDQPPTTPTPKEKREVTVTLPLALTMACPKPKPNPNLNRLPTTAHK
ncbi:unnamed protein product [Discosporangium mesarthrocarpum]